MPWIAAAAPLLDAVPKRVMLTVARHLAAVLALPVMAVVVVPVILAQRSGLVAEWPRSAIGFALCAIGSMLLLAGAVLFASSLYQFAARGRGTLAPWDPPLVLVIEGPYRYVRNPMISGVIFLLLGEAAILRFMPQLEWAIVFVTINAIYIPLMEEPMLERRFGESYREYRRHVRRFLPRVRPWKGPSSETAA